VIQPIPVEKTMWSRTPTPPPRAFSQNRVRPAVEVLDERCCPTALRLEGAVLHPVRDQAANHVRIAADGLGNRVQVAYDTPGGVHAAPVPSARHARASHHRRQHHPRHRQPPIDRKHVLVNGVPLSAAGLQALRQLGLHPLRGAYWYDSVSGAAGVLGQGTAGFLPPGLPLGGPLQADASNGTSSVFVNGRQLTTGEEGFLETVVGGPIAPGRYFLDANGDAGLEGGPVLVNLVQLARQKGVGHVDPLSTYDLTGISVLGDGSIIGILNHDGPSVTFA
jgi:hypothetical protein